MQMLRLRSLISSCVVALTGIVFGAFLAITRGRNAVTVVAWSLGMGAVTGAVSLVFMRFMSQTAGAGFLAFTQPSGASTPSEAQFSYQDALAARGDVDAALASYESLIQAASPQDAAVRLRAADLYVETRRDANRTSSTRRIG